MSPNSFWEIFFLKIEVFDFWERLKNLENMAMAAEETRPANATPSTDAPALPGRVRVGLRPVPWQAGAHLVRHDPLHPRDARERVSE